MNFLKCKTSTVVSLSSMFEEAHQQFQVTISCAFWMSWAMPLKCSLFEMDLKQRYHFQVTFISVKKRFLLLHQLIQM